VHLAAGAVLRSLEGAGEQERQSHVTEQQLEEEEEVVVEEQQLEEGEEQQQVVVEEQHSEVARLEVELLIWAVVEAEDEMNSRPGQVSEGVVDAPMKMTDVEVVTQLRKVEVQL
jgi:hypothetical protein